MYSPCALAHISTLLLIYYNTQKTKVILQFKNILYIFTFFLPTIYPIQIIGPVIFMNKPLYFKICSFVIGGFLVVWSAAFTVFMLKERVRQNNNYENLPYESVQHNTSYTKNAELDHFLACSSDGRVVVYEVYSNGYSRLMAVLDIQLEQLSKEDRAFFEGGIVLKSREELASLTEDFTS